MGGFWWWKPTAKILVGNKAYVTFLGQPFLKRVIFLITISGHSFNKIEKEKQLLINCQLLIHTILSFWMYRRILFLDQKMKINKYDFLEKNLLGTKCDGNSVD